MTQKTMDIIDTTVTIAVLIMLITAMATSNLVLLFAGFAVGILGLALDMLVFPRILKNSSGIPKAVPVKETVTSKD